MSENGNRSVLVIGGGAAGMMAALFASRAGAQVTLLEGNEKLGKKIYITGKGRCNLTNTAEPEAFMRQIVRNPRFAYAALSVLNNEQLMQLFESLGVPLREERGGRVFPESDRASDITRALERALGVGGVRIELNARVEEILVEEGSAAGVLLKGGKEIRADHVILATGGMSYPATGSTGDGYRMAKALGHTIEKPRPALTSIRTRESWPGTLAGLTLRNVRLSASSNGKRLYSEQGELLFTHEGISGPLALTLSSLLPEEPTGVGLSIDLKPALDEPTLDARLVRDFREMSRKQLITIGDGLAPHNLALRLIELAGLAPEMPANSVTQSQRRAFSGVIKDLRLTVEATGGFQEAVITRGGVHVKQINPSTMESKLIQGLYFAGEVIDIDALTGGFNLQLAFSTGALAGMSAAARAQ